MITRLWHGYTLPENADRYEDLLTNKIMPGIAARNIPGFLGYEILKNVVSTEQVEFITLLKFDKLDDIKGFVGSDYERANLPEEALKVLSSYDTHAKHYEVRTNKQVDQKKE